MRDLLGQSPERSGTIAKRTRIARISLFGVIGATIGVLLLLHQKWPLDKMQTIATIAVAIAAMVLTRFHIRHTKTDPATPEAAERIVWAVAILAIGGVQLVQLAIGPQDVRTQGFLLTAPLVAQAMLLSALLNPAISLFALTVVAFLLGSSGALQVDLLAASWLAGAVGAHAVNPLKQRSDLLRAVSIQAGAQAVLAAAITAMRVSTLQPVILAATWAAIAAIAATSVFWLGVTLFERIFGLISDWSLLEICSPEHPLLRELCLKAPGSYAHSVMVANLAEQAARAIGANPIYCRAMAYFHDVGKLTRPSYFIENQIGENAHDSLPPTLSAKIITSHVTDGLELARKHHLPQIVIDGIEQHHGTSLVTYFYNRALTNSTDVAQGNYNFESLFRYAGPKPRTREAAILHLADQVEAASRTVGSGRSEQLEAMIIRLVEQSRQDGQLDESELTFRDLDLVRKAFLQSLCAIRHERIEYQSVSELADVHPAALPSDAVQQVLKENRSPGNQDGSD